MEQLQLYLDDLKQTASGVDGVLYVSAGDACFPCENWREPVSAVLEQWIPSFLSFAQGHTDGCLLEFMDGPYAVKMRGAGSGEVRMKWLRDSRETAPEKPIQLAELMGSVLKCLRTYDRTLHQWGEAPRWTKEQSVLKQLLKQV